MEYNLDLDRLSVQEYKDLLKQQNLLPGRRILWHDIDKNSALFESKGIKSVADLKNKGKGAGGMILGAQKLAIKRMLRCLYLIPHILGTGGSTESDWLNPHLSDSFEL